MPLRDTRAVAQLKDQLAGRSGLVGPEQQHPGRVVAAQTSSAGQCLERVLLELLLAELLGVVGEDDAGVRIHCLANTLHPLGQEEQHGAVIVLAAGVTAVEEVADRIDGDDVGRLAAESLRDRRDHLCQPCVIEHQPQLRCGDEVGAGIQKTV